MPSSASDARATRSRRALKAALLTLAGRKPIEEITVREICAEAGVHYATFFRHHPSKEALLVDLAAEQIDRVVELSLPVLDSTDTYGAVLAVVQYVDDHRSLWTGLLTGGAAGAMREELLRLARQVALEKGAQGDWLPMQLAVNCSVSLIFETLAFWLGEMPEALPPERVAQMLDRLLSAVQQA